MNVEAENAVMRERARIREELVKLDGINFAEFSMINGLKDEGEILLKRSKVLAIISGDKPQNGTIE